MVYKGENEAKQKREAQLIKDIFNQMAKRRDKIEMKEIEKYLQLILNVSSSSRPKNENPLDHNLDTSTQADEEALKKKKQKEASLRQKSIPLLINRQDHFNQQHRLQIEAQHFEEATFQPVVSAKSLRIFEKMAGEHSDFYSNYYC